MTLYDSIGTGYNSTRHADPFIVSTLYNLLDVKHSGPYLEIGCGTCNYLEALSQKGLHFYGVDPSETMLHEARKKNTGAILLNGTAENIPLQSDYFYGAIAVLTLHHWKDLRTGLKEVHRVLQSGSKFVAFSFSPQQRVLSKNDETK
jgi:ubiquinone/menaquinone biosynthesis C-methylase UbiE